MRQTGYGLNDNVQQQVDRTNAAARVSLRPPEKGAFGSYALSMRSGLVAAGMVGPLAIWEMRWPSLSVNALVRRVRVSAAAVTLFAAGEFGISLFRATSFSVLDATGAAAAITLLGKSQARSTRFAPTQLQSQTQTFVILGTAATGLTGGTKTLDNNPFAGLSAGVPVTGGTGNTYIIPPGTLLLDSSATTVEPVELATNEGLVIRAEAVPATGTWTFTVEVEWDEIDPARYFALIG